jgi:hypothetical protein
VAEGQNGRLPDPGIKQVLEELRNLRREMRDDRRQAEMDLGRANGRS